MAVCFSSCASGSTLLFKDYMFVTWRESHSSSETHFWFFHPPDKAPNVSQRAKHLMNERLCNIHFEAKVDNNAVANLWLPVSKILWFTENIWMKLPKYIMDGWTSAIVKLGLVWFEMVAIDDWKYKNVFNFVHSKEMFLTFANTEKATTQSVLDTLC